MNDYLKHINNARQYCHFDPGLVFFIVRDWDITKQVGLTDYVWTAYKQGNTSPNEAIDILDKLEAFVREERK